MASLFKRDGKNWYVKYRIRGRIKRISCMTTKKTVAREWLLEAMKIERGEAPDFALRQQGGVTLGDYAVVYMEDCKVNNSADWAKIKGILLKAHIIPFFGTNCALESIDRLAIERYRASRRGKVCAKTINSEVRIITSLLRHAAEMELIPYASIPRIKKLPTGNGRIRFLSRDEIERLLSALDQCPTAQQTYVMLMLYAGLRAGEALFLRWVDIDFEHGVLHVTPREDWKPKSQHHRAVPLAGRLLEHLTSIEPKGEYVVRDGAKRGVKRSFSAIARLAGLPTQGEGKVTAHTLRHTFASYLVMSGVPLYTVGTFLGHSSSETTRIYAHLSPDHAKQMIKGIDY
jgi:integrase